jgi:hypothetical protein
VLALASEDGIAISNAAGGTRTAPLLLDTTDENGNQWIFENLLTHR